MGGLNDRSSEFMQETPKHIPSVTLGQTYVPYLTGSTIQSRYNHPPSSIPGLTTTSTSSYDLKTFCVSPDLLLPL